MFQKVKVQKAICVCVDCVCTYICAHRETHIQIVLVTDTVFGHIAISEFNFCTNVTAK